MPGTRNAPSNAEPFSPRNGVVPASGYASCHAPLSAVMMTIVLGASTRMTSTIRPMLSSSSNADVDLGDLLIHEGPAVEAQRNAAQIFGADKTYFVLNGTSTSNKIVTNAVLRRGDLVLFDRNNHKSLHQGALVQAGAIPIFLPTSRNAFGMIGAV